MRIVFRADASRLIGTGHIVRCRTLAGALARRGASIEFICRHGNDASRLLEGTGFRVHTLPAAGSSPAPEGPYAEWLGTSEAEDARQTAELLGGLRPDWLVVDHYALSAAWERSLRPHVGKLLAIDDIARTHACDVLLDQNFAHDPQARYEGRVPPGCRMALGPHYALLHESYAASNEARDPAGAVRRIAVFFGGVDPENFTGLTLEALDHASFKGITVDIVVGASNVSADAITSYAPAHVKVNIHRALPTLAGVLASADLAIGAGGGNTWERCCLGVPSLVVSLAENQTPASQALGQAGIVVYLGPAQDVGVAEIREAVRALIADPARRQSLSELSRLLVDGHGALRVAEILMPTPVEALTLRPAAETDRAFFFHFANDPLVRAQSFSTEKIPWERHKEWFAARISSRSARMFVLEAQGLATGIIRFDLADEHATLNYGLETEGRGKKWGVALVELGLRALAAEWSGDVHALVKRSNVPSCAVFERLSFRTHKATDEQMVYVLPAQDLRARFSP